MTHEQKLAHLNVALDEAKSSKARWDIAGQICAVLAEMLKAETKRCTDMTDMKRRVISPLIGMDWYIMLSAPLCGGTGYALVHRNVLEELNTSPDMEPFIWILEGLRGRN